MCDCGRIPIHRDGAKLLSSNAFLRFRECCLPAGPADDPGRPRSDHASVPRGAHSSSVHGREQLGHGGSGLGCEVSEGGVEAGGLVVGGGRVRMRVRT